MAALSMQIMFTAILICFYSIGVFMLYEFNDLPFWFACLAVILFFSSAATIFVSALVLIWT